MGNIFVFEVEVLKLGTDEVLKKLHFLAWNMFQCIHIVNDYLFDDENPEFRDELVEVGAIRKLREIKNICNPYFSIEMDMEDDEHEYDPQTPFKLLDNVGKNDEQIMSFKHSCGCEIKVVNFNWPYIICPNEKCKKRILHRDIEEVGGIYLFTGMDDNKK